MATKHPPCRPTTLTPFEIIGHALYSTFVEHYKLAAQNNLPDEFEKAISKKFSGDTRSAIGNAYEMLRDHGFYPSGVSRDGQNVEFLVMVDNRPDWKARHDLDKAPAPNRHQIEAMREECKDNFRQISRGVELIQDDKDFEEVWA